jgi:hypothetical protein
MTLDRDLDHVLDAWLTDGPTIVADRVIDGVAVRIVHQRQRPAWRLRAWRSYGMSTTLRAVALAAALITALVAGTFVIVGGGNRGGPTAAPSVTAPPSSSASLTQTPAASISAWWQTDKCGACAGDLTAGTHASQRFQPAVTYVVKAGWVNNDDVTNGFQLLPDNAANRSCLASQAATCQLLTINRDMRLAASDCSNDAAPGAKLDAAAVVAGLRARPGLVVSKAVPTSVGGLQGLQFDVQLADDWTTSCGETGDVAVATFYDGQAHWEATKDGRSRFTLLDVPPGANALIEIYTSSSDAFAGFQAEAAQIVDSFRFAPGG